MCEVGLESAGWDLILRFPRVKVGVWVRLTLTLILNLLQHIFQIWQPSLHGINRIPNYKSQAKFTHFSKRLTSWVNSLTVLFTGIYMKQSIGLLNWLALYCHTGTTESVLASTVTCSNDEWHNGDVSKIKMIKMRTKCSTEKLFYNYFVGSWRVGKFMEIFCCLKLLPEVYSC